MQCKTAEKKENNFTVEFHDVRLNDTTSDLHYKHINKNETIFVG